MNTNDWRKYVIGKIDSINCCPIQQYMIVLTFEPDDDLKQVIKEHNCTYRVIPKEYIPAGEEDSCFIMPMPMPMPKISYNKGVLINDCTQSL